MIQWKCGAGKKPITKNGNPQKANQNKGATPIEKNVIVVDEQGNEYEATYPKRAKGLVKNGRARFVGENKICLACPPDKVMEENEMEENKQAVKKTEDNNLTAKEAKNNNLTAREIFEKIAELQQMLLAKLAQKKKHY